MRSTSSAVEIAKLGRMTGSPFLFNNLCNGSKAKKVSFKSVRFYFSDVLCVPHIRRYEYSTEVEYEGYCSQAEIIAGPNEYIVAQTSRESEVS